MTTDPDDIFTRALLEPATQALLARLKPQDCDGIPSEVVNASALLDRVCDVLGVPLVDLLRTVEALPRWVPVESVKPGTRYFAEARRPDLAFYVYEEPQVWHADCITFLEGSYVLIGGLYPPPPKVTR